MTPAGETSLLETADWWEVLSPAIAYVEALGIGRLDHLRGIHAQADRTDGHAAVIQWAEPEGDGIRAVFDNGVAHESKTEERYPEPVDASGVDLFTLTKAMTFRSLTTTSRARS